MILALILPGTLAAMSLTWAYNHRNDDRLADVPAPRHMAG